jgi:hypothetical protein
VFFMLLTSGTNLLNWAKEKGSRKFDLKFPASEEVLTTGQCICKFPLFSLGHDIQ